MQALQVFTIGDLLQQEEIEVALCPICDNPISHFDRAIAQDNWGNICLIHYTCGEELVGHDDDGEDE